MKRALVGAVLAAVIFAIPAQGGPASPRRVAEVPYLTPAMGAHAGVAYGWYYDCEKSLGCVILPVKKGDRSVQLEVVDASGGSVFAAVYTMPGGNHYFDFCGSTNEAMPVAPGTELLVHVIGGTCPDGTISTPTNGNVRATFTRRR